jgi:hypothetical protein
MVAVVRTSFSPSTLSINTIQRWSGTEKWIVSPVVAESSRITGTTAARSSWAGCRRDPIADAFDVINHRVGASSVARIHPSSANVASIRCVVDLGSPSARASSVTPAGCRSETASSTASAAATLLTA